MMTEETKRKIVQLDVGGTLHKVSRDTLERCKGSMLASLALDYWKEGNSDDNEAIFIDRNGRLFEYVLDYLRASEVFLPSSVIRTAMKKEFDFYGIDADMSKVYTQYGPKYLQDLVPRIQAAQNDLDLLKAEKLAIQTSAWVEDKFLRLCSTGSSPVRVDLPSDSISLLCGHEDFFRERLLDRGLQCGRIAYGSGVYFINVTEAST